MTDKIRRLEEQLRDLLEGDRRSFPERRWNELIAALDNIGDTTMAIVSYQRSGIGKETGTKYLRLFGYLQCIFLQQDSIRLLSRVLSKRWKDPERDTAWTELRRVRNEIAGHPAERAAAVARITMRSRGFRMVHWGLGRPKFEDVDLHSLTHRYLTEATAILGGVVEAVKGGF